MFVETDIEPEYAHALVLLKKKAVEGMTISEFAKASDIDINKATRILVVVEARGHARLRKAGMAKIYFPVEKEGRAA